MYARQFRRFCDRTHGIARFVLRVGIISNFLKKQLTHKAEYGINIECSADIGDWSSGMTGVSKTLSGSSILSSPVSKNAEKSYKSRTFSVFDFLQITKGINPLLLRNLKAFKLRRSGFLF